MDAGSLSGQVALVTGSGTGIGAATALALAQRGARVAVHYHQSAAGAQGVVRQIEQQGGRALAVAADLTDESQATNLVHRVVAHFDRLDILVNNAGSPLERSSLEHCPLDLWRRAFDVNVTSAFLVTRAAIPALRAARGRIINNLSLSVQTGGAGGAGPYAASSALLTSTNMLVLATCVLPFQATPQCFPQVLIRHPWRVSAGHLKRGPLIC